MTSRACATCRFMEVSERDKAYGICHRYPPIERRQALVLVMEWCGEYLPKKGK